jgi:hypothetical protein
MRRFLLRFTILSLLLTLSTLAPSSRVASAAYPACPSESCATLVNECHRVGCSSIKIQLIGFCSAGGASFDREYFVECSSCVAGDCV